MNEEIRLDKRLLAFAKPPLVAIDKVELYRDDVLVLCAGFEDRALGCLQKALDSKSSNFETIIVEYLPFIKQNKLQEIERLCVCAGSKIKKETYDRENPAGFAENILRHLENSAGRIFIDLSGMSRLLIVQLIVSLISKPILFQKVVLLYCEAEIYPPSKDEVKNKIELQPNALVMFLSYGIYDLVVMPELSSVALQGQPIRLVVFPTFNTNQLTALRSELQPAYLTIMHGIPPHEEIRWRRDAIAQINHISKFKNIEEYDVCTLDYQDALNKLLEIYDQHGVFEKLVIAPTGSKMQTIAVGLFRAFLGDVQIVFPKESYFENPDNYTKGIRQIYSLSLAPFCSVWTSRNFS